jgi:hypothetical protein
MKYEDRHMLVVPEKQETIQKMDQQYQTMKNDPNAAKVKSLEAAGKALKIATAAVGVITVIDWIVPDPVLGIDEIGLTALTTLLGTASTIVNNKKAQLEATGEVNMSMEEVQTLAKQVGDARNKCAASRANLRK